MGGWRAVMANEYRSTIEQPSDRIIVALDKMTWHVASEVMGEVGPHVGMAKANSIAQRHGWEPAVRTIESLGAATMADTKFHDIPETVGLQVEEVASTGARLITVHASGGQEMLKYAVSGRDRAFNDQPEDRWDDLLGGILGITVLTSIDGETCTSIYGDEPEKKVVQFAHIALEAGIDGIVCSGKELRAIRAIGALDDLIAVVPGITPEWAKKPGDQKRVVTPTEAFQAGADFLVVGRAITQPPEGISRQEAAERIATELTEAA
ncbi:orotidine-5'-phosphate decarboxylase [Patescibacteria group bacterium]|nr:MAG: orotidine-5'-phosphate decarboxylase [Patescibacteria group bacterium]